MTKRVIHSITDASFVHNLCYFCLVFVMLSCASVY